MCTGLRESSVGRPSTAAARESGPHSARTVRSEIGIKRTQTHARCAALGREFCLPSRRFENGARWSCMGAVSRSRALLSRFFFYPLRRFCAVYAVPASERKAPRHAPRSFAESVVEPCAASFLIHSTATDGSLRISLSSARVALNDGQVGLGCSLA